MAFADHDRQRIQSARWRAFALLVATALLVVVSACASRQRRAEVESEARPILLCPQGVRMVHVNNLGSRPINVYTYLHGEPPSTSVLVGILPARLTREFPLEDSVLVSASALPVDTL